MQQKCNTQHTLHSLLLLLDLLLDGIILELEGEDGAEVVGDGVKAAGCLVWVEDDEFGEHEVAERADVVLVLQAGDDAVVEVEDVNAGESSLH